MEWNKWKRIAYVNWEEQKCSCLLLPAVNKLVEASKLQAAYKDEPSHPRNGISGHANELRN